MTDDPSARPGDVIVVGGARQNNLKNVDLRIPKHRLTVFTGVSGSGKSSMVFGTIAVESQRQLNETFPWFIRNRLPRYERPDAEVIENLSTAVVIDQRPVGGNARSTVGTMTEINPILRVLFSRHGRPSAGPSHAYSFNDPRGMCEECEGLGTTVRLDLGRLLDEDKSLNEGAIRFPAFAPGTFLWQLYAESGLFDPDLPIREFSDADRELLLYGSGFTVDRRGRNGVYKNAYEGIVLRFERRYLKDRLDGLKAKDRAAVEQVVVEGACPVCGGSRLNRAALDSRIDGDNIADYAALEVGELIPRLARIEAPTVRPVAEAAVAALRGLEAVGLGYLSLDRETSTLSGGEAQRLKLVRHLRSSLADLTYIFDEPSVGLHPRDVRRMTGLLRALRDKGNTVLVVEHDRAVIESADHVVDMGPGAGGDGGQVIYEGTVDGLRRAGTPTGRSLLTVPGLKGRYRVPTGTLPIRNAGLHNLRDITVGVPTGVLTCVTGVAGSGKSTLISKVFTAQHPETVVVDQSAIGVSTRSTPATYLDVMDAVRRLFARTSGTDPGLFSFNSTGACPECQGRGYIETDLAFLDPVTTVCERCAGRRYNDEALRHTVRGRTIADVLAMTAEDAHGFFDDARIRSGLSLLREVGLGYLTLGQPLSTLSGGERQRLKLAHRLRDRGVVYVFDEPTTGLHMADTRRLLRLLDRLVDGGNTVIVIEHDLDVVKYADWVIDLGPEAGRHGGRVLYEGRPDGLLTAEGSHTGRCLAEDLRRAGHSVPA
ncbi:ATP-binding cassette domain-containing protein [Actinoallomurus rhizosphaericola]|uniref:ATP-binding cassette domain-containing protein n=1 Tax=Actinoallomurus rhizosphaericola TaxID=2952536 RepID=UPI0020925F47|nr:excinuclease ABC subunit UvrA [Actinoallomurus rhizosphaericola]MCO5995441.1 excinuclease ABC subunit UvrA [Actinoallomurus rhizosphaericola]